MGTDVEVLLHRQGPVTPTAVLDRLADLEARWSRFRADSEITRCNRRSAEEGRSGRGAGTGAVVSSETVALVERMVHGWDLTDGRFDPTVLDALEAAGYDRDLELVLADGPAPDRGPRPVPGCGGVRVDAAIGLVHLPPGVRLDPGGCGKGLAADLAAVEAVGAGAGGALVSVGGDLRVAGEAPPEGWEVEVDHLLGPTVRVNLEAGALATSSTLRRRWAVAGADRGGGGGVAHHVIDPSTCRPTSGAVVSVSVVAAEAWLAEVLATALLVSGGASVGAADDVLATSAGALVTRADGRRHRVGRHADAFDLGGR